MATYKKTAIDLSTLQAVRFQPKGALQVAITKIYLKSKNAATYALIWEEGKKLVILRYSTPFTREVITETYEFTEGMTWAELAALHPSRLCVDPRGRVVFAEFGEIDESGMPEILTPFTFWVTLDELMPVYGTDTVTGTEKLMVRTV